MWRNHDFDFDTPAHDFDYDAPAHHDFDYDAPAHHNYAGSHNYVGSPSPLAPRAGAPHRVLSIRRRSKGRTHALALHSRSHPALVRVGQTRPVVSGHTAGGLRKWS
jgi:hypothetical protein